MNLRPTDKIMKDSSAVQIKHHEAYHNLLFVLFPDEVFLVEVNSKQVIYSAQIDANSSLCKVKEFSAKDLKAIGLFKAS